VAQMDEHPETLGCASTRRLQLSPKILGKPK